MINFINNIFKKVDNDILCPYCNFNLESRPERKTKCKNCNNYIFVRTEQKTKNKILVTEDRAKEMDKEYEESYIISSLMNYFDEKDILEKRKELKNKFKQDPGENDILWGLIQDSSIKNFTQYHFGSYRCDIYNRAKLSLYKEYKNGYKESIKYYFEVFILDYNGVNNTGKDMLDYVPVFTKDSSSIAPAIITEINEIIKKYNINKEDVSNYFLKAYKELEISFNNKNAMIIDVNECYNKLIEELDKLN